MTFSFIDLNLTTIPCSRDMNVIARWCLTQTFSHVIEPVYLIVIFLFGEFCVDCCERGCRYLPDGWAKEYIASSDMRRHWMIPKYLLLIGFLYVIGRQTP